MGLIFADDLVLILSCDSNLSQGSEFGHHLPEIRYKKNLNRVLQNLLGKNIHSDKMYGILYIVPNHLSLDHPCCLFKNSNSTGPGQIKKSHAWPAGRSRAQRRAPGCRPTLVASTMQGS